MKRPLAILALPAQADEAHRIAKAQAVYEAHSADLCPRNPVRVTCRYRRMGLGLYVSHAVRRYQEDRAEADNGEARAHIDMWA